MMIDLTCDVQPRVQPSSHRSRDQYLLGLFSLLSLLLISNILSSLVIPHLAWSQPQSQRIPLQKFSDTKSAESALPVLRAHVDTVLSQLKEAYPQARVSMRDDRVGPALLLKLNAPLVGETPRERAQSLINRYEGLWGSAELYIHSIYERKDRVIVELHARLQGLEILNQNIRLSLRDQRVQHLSNGVGAINALITAQVDESIARKSSLKALNDRGVLGGMARVVDLKRGALSNTPGVAFEIFEVRLADLTQARTWIAWIDGRDGAVIQLRRGELK